MKILFYYKEAESLGIEYLSSVLKQAGHKTELIFDFGSSNKFGVVKSSFFKLADETNKLIRKAKQFSPDLIAFSCETDSWQDTKKMAYLLKKELGAPTIIGGRHATNLPEYVIQDKNFDMLCRGEGEEAILDLVENLEKGKSITKIKNLWVKQGGKVYKNPVRPLIKDLDKLPFPDRDLFHKYGVIGSQLMIMASRGCPYSCSYCNNSFYRDLYKNKGLYVRRRSVNKVIEEMKYFIRKYNIKKMHIEDENFTTDINWLREFTKRYKEEIGLPYWCQSNPNNINEEVINLIKKSNCIQIFMGVESGDEDIRKNIYNRYVTNEQIIKAARLIKKAKIGLECTSIFGAPGESPASMWKTVNFIEKIKPGSMPTYTLYPYPNTRIFRYCKENGYLTEEAMRNIQEGKEGSHGHSIIKTPYANLAYNISKLLSLYVRSPSILKPLIRKLMKNKKNKLVNYAYLFMLPFDYPFVGRERIKVFFKNFIKKKLRFVA